MAGEGILELKNHIEQVALLSADGWRDLEAIVDIREIGNESFLVKEGVRATDEVFVIRGIFRGFYRSFEGEEVNVAFFPKGSVLPPLHIRTRDGISLMNIQALATGVVAHFNAESFSRLRYRHEALMKYGNVVVERELAYKTMRELMLLTQNAEQRYLAFREIYPGLENSIPQYHIASYLGITPISLSRIRKSLAGS